LASGRPARIFFILYAFIILAALNGKAGDGLQPMILRPAVWPPLTFPNEVGGLADCMIGAVIRCWHFFVLLSRNPMQKWLLVVWCDRH